MGLFTNGLQLVCFWIQDSGINHAGKLRMQEYVLTDILSIT